MDDSPWMIIQGCWGGVTRAYQDSWRMFRSPHKAVPWSDLSQLGFEVKHLPTAGSLGTGDAQSLGSVPSLGSPQAGKLLQSP